MKTECIRDIEIPIKVVIGETEISLEALTTLKTGHIIELRSLVTEPVTIEAADKIIAKGEVVVIEENFGIRITEILDNSE